jgi:hypothetical protein
MANTKTLTPKEVAAEFGTSPKRLRKFLRAEARENETETPGKGGRWAIPAGTVKSMRKRFDSWAAEEARRRAEQAAEKAEANETEDDSDEEATDDSED